MYDLGNVEDRENVVSLARYHDSQMMTLNEEAEAKIEFELKLGALVDEEMLNISSDYTQDAILRCPDEWRDFIASIPCDSIDDISIVEAQHIVRSVLKFVSCVQDRVESHMSDVIDE